jgi:K+-sensing histidine kinase KdpD
VDTLIENAVRHTPEAGTVRVFCSEYRDTVLIGVADSGQGFTADQRRWLNASSPHAETALDEAEIAPGEHTGFGLGIVREVVGAGHGAVRVGTAREGGALVVVLLPTRQAQPAPRGAAPSQRLRRDANRSTRVW